MADIPDSDDETKRRLRAHRREIDEEQSQAPGRGLVERVKQVVLSK